MIPWETLHNIGQILEDGELDEIELEDDSYRIRMSRKPSGTPVAQAPTTTPEASSEAGAATETTAEATEDSSVPNEWEPIESPMVGTFYEAPAPAADPFVEVGDRVSFDTTVCIIEAMKLMNEIEAETEGELKKVCVDDAEPVSKGDVLFYVDPE